MYINREINYIEYLKDKNIVIFGAGFDGAVLYRNLINEGIKVNYFVDNDKTKNNTKYFDIGIISFHDFKKINDNNFIIIIACDDEKSIKEQLLKNGIFNFISAKQIDFKCCEISYDKEYFKWQKSIGEFGCKISKEIFQPYIKSRDVVVEFGSAGGFLLNLLTCKEKIGVEINDIARENAALLGIKSVKTIDEIEDNYADVIISTHVLEHVENPCAVLRCLKRKLKKGGKIVFQVPNEDRDAEYKKNDWDMHLYTWNCLTLGNLFKMAGFFVLSVETLPGLWPHDYEFLYNNFGEEMFKELSSTNGMLKNEYYCLIVAENS